MYGSFLTEQDPPAWTEQLEPPVVQEPELLADSTEQWLPADCEEQVPFAPLAEQEPP